MIATDAMRIGFTAVPHDSETLFQIKIGRSDAGNWHGILTLPDGTEHSTQAYDSYDQCKAVINEWLLANDVSFDWHRVQ